MLLGNRNRKSDGNTSVLESLVNMSNTPPRNPRTARNAKDRQSPAQPTDTPIRGRAVIFSEPEGVELSSLSLPRPGHDFPTRLTSQMEGSGHNFPEYFNFLIEPTVSSQQTLFPQPSGSNTTHDNDSIQVESKHRDTEDDSNESEDNDPPKSWLELSPSMTSQSPGNSQRALTSPQQIWITSIKDFTPQTAAHNFLHPSEPPHGQFDAWRCVSTLSPFYLKPHSTTESPSIKAKEKWKPELTSPFHLSQRVCKYVNRHDTAEVHVWFGPDILACPRCCFARFGFLDTETRERYRLSDSEEGD